MHEWKIAYLTASTCFNIIGTHLQQKIRKDWLVTTLNLQQHDTWYNKEYQILQNILLPMHKRKRFNAHFEKWDINKISKQHETKNLPNLKLQSANLETSLPYKTLNNINITWVHLTSNNNLCISINNWLSSYNCEISDSSKNKIKTLKDQKKVRELLLPSWITPHNTDSTWKCTNFKDLFKGF